jgi:hypothetical protein
LYGAETWTLRKVDQQYLESFEMWCWRRMEISLTDRVKKKRSITLSQWGEEHSTCNTRKEG